jgi:hypothetical protein
MYFKSKKTSLLILGITAIACSRLLFFIFNDPEGPNLLVVIGMAAIIYFLSLAGYLRNFSDRKKFLSAIFIQILIVTGLGIVMNSDQASADYKNSTYTIEGREVTLKNGIAEIEAAPGSASKITTRYFGNELRTDLNGDRREDVVFLLTQSGGGSGTFYYAVAALNAGEGYIGSDGYLLGDRIAPQTTEMSQNPQHKNVIVVNYADHASGEPMIAQPSVGKSVYLKLDATSMQWGIVAADFEGESR